MEKHLKVTRQVQRNGKGADWDGNSCFLWDDLWDNEILSQKFPELFSFAKNKQIVFADGYAQPSLHNLFHLPLSQKAHTQLLSLQNMFEEVDVQGGPDKWLYI